MGKTMKWFVEFVIGVDVVLAGVVIIVFFVHLIWLTYEVIKGLFGFDSYESGVPKFKNPPPPPIRKINHE